MLTGSLDIVKHPELSQMIYYDLKEGWRIRPLSKSLHTLVSSVEQKLKPPIGLKGYFFSPKEIHTVCQHNARWAEGLLTSPRYLFAYINLPTSCNLRCRGCFQLQDKHPTRGVRIRDSLIWEKFDEILSTLKKYGAQSVVYPGRGELLTDPDSLDYIERVRVSGLDFVLFTNGTFLADYKLASQLANLDVSIILSFRDTTELHNDGITHRKSFQQSLAALDNFLTLGLAEQNRLAVELPVTRENRDRAADLLVLCRKLNVFPLIEMYIVTALNDEEKKLSLTFSECDEFFDEMAKVDRSLGFGSEVYYGQRVIAQEMCLRPHYSFTVNDDGNVFDCLTNRVTFGNIIEKPLSEILQSKAVRSLMGSEVYCPCSVFATVGRRIRQSKISEKLKTLIGAKMNIPSVADNNPQDVGGCQEKYLAVSHPSHSKDCQHDRPAAHRT